MRTAMLRAPWWVLSLVSGGLFGAGQLVFRLASGDPVPVALLIAMLGGLFFGLLMGPVLRRINQRAQGAAGDLPPTQLRAASRATLRGPVPHDLDVRRASASLARHQLGELRRVWWAPLLYVFLAVLSVGLAITSSAWWALTLAIWLGLLAYQLWLPGHLRRRLVLLDEPEA